jgi:alginate O-acetyltransferase complex protein AlgJ
MRSYTRNMNASRTRILRALTLIAIGAGSSLAFLTGSLAETASPKQVPGTDISIGKDSFLFSNLDIFASYSESSQRRLDRSLEIVSQVNAVLQKRGIHLTLVLVPSVFKIYEDRLPDDFKLSKGLRGVYAHSLKKLRDDGVNAPDLNAAFLKARGPAGNDFPLYMRQDNHWSTVGSFEGARVVAAAVSTAFKTSLASLPERNSRYEWLPPIPHEGNYYRSLPASERAKIVQGQIKPLRFTRETGTDLLASDAPGVALVGSSFSKLSEYHFGEALSYFLHRDVLNAALTGKSFWTPMVEYLASDAFQDNPPKLLIWEIPEEHLAPGASPIDWKDAWTRRQFLLEVGANLAGECQTGTQPIATLASDFGGDMTSMKVVSTSAKSFVKYQFAAPIRNDQYLSVRVKSESADSFLVESAMGPPQRYYSKLTSYGQFHRVNVPLATVADGKARSLIVRTASGSDFALEAPRLCAMPAGLNAIAKLDEGH